MYTWEELYHFINHCNRCELCQTRNFPVMGRGNIQSRIQFISEAPGAQEDIQGIPFVGPSGQLFDKLLSLVSMTRNDLYLTNIVKCRPPHNRDPKESEQEACIPYLKYETLLVKPLVIICLGRIAAKRIIRSDYRITQEHGTWIYRKNCWLTATYHPSAVLRDPRKMDDIIKDFESIKQKIDEVKSNQ